MALENHKALYMDSDAQLLVRDGPVEPHRPDELLIETLYSGVNPADVKHGAILGIRPVVMGYDFCGTVLSAPPTSKFAKGDVVMGCTPSGIGRPARFGAHQTYISCPEDMPRKVPSNLPHADAAALTVVAMTATDVLYSYFKFPLPGSPNPKPLSSPLLIWGASAGVGICAVQFARASGCQHIFVTASPARHELLRQLGATECFDYASPTVVSDIAAAVKALDKGPILHALDAAGSHSTPSSADMMIQCVTDPNAIIVSSVFQQDKRFLMPFALSKYDWEFHPTGAPKSITIPARLADYVQASAAFQWAIDNYGTGFKLPSVTAFDGTAEEALAELTKVADSKMGFGKLVIKHPMI